MIQLVHPPLPPILENVALFAGDSCDWIDALESRISEDILQDAAGSQEVGERRRGRRRAYPEPILLTPLKTDGSPQTEATFSVIGHHLSERGVDFYADRPLPERYLIASFPLPGGEWMSFVLNLTWCRFNRFGWYDNGGRFLRAVRSPFALQDG